MRLDATLDKIAQRPPHAVPLSQSDFALPADQLREAAIIHLATLLSLIPTDASGDPIQFGNLAVGLMPSTMPAQIAYADVGAAFEVRGATISQSDGPGRLLSLLELLQYARDHSDGLLYLPSTIRNDRIEGWAKLTGASVRFVRFLLANYPALARSVAQ
jgi:hypothetical protein